MLRGIIVIKNLEPSQRISDHSTRRCRNLTTHNKEFSQRDKATARKSQKKITQPRCDTDTCLKPTCIFSGMGFMLSVPLPAKSVTKYVRISSTVVAEKYDPSHTHRDAAEIPHRQTSSFQCCQRAISKITSRGRRS